ncbi:MAG: PilZ domain-containing protein [Methylococcaceae bacterium]|nr:PilZ domain-containing protein [Methylococcaceae bacterium]
MSNDDEAFAAFNFDFSEHLKINKRLGVRYHAPASTLTLRKSSLLGFGSDFTGTLIDISAKGALVNCKEPLPVKSSLSLKIVFHDGTLFNVTGKVIREKSRQHFGIKFDKYNHPLDDYLFKLHASKA